jgi:hypothetical protein
VAQSETLGFSGLSMRANLSDVGPNLDSSLEEGSERATESVRYRTEFSCWGGPQEKWKAWSATWTSKQQEQRFRQEVPGRGQMAAAARHLVASVRWNFRIASTQPSGDWELRVPFSALWQWRQGMTDTSTHRQPASQKSRVALLTRPSWSSTRLDRRSQPRRGLPDEASINK